MSTLSRHKDSRPKMFTPLEGRLLLALLVLLLIIILLPFIHGH